jgi:hypothetical protein
MPVARSEIESGNYRVTAGNSGERRQRRVRRCHVIHLKRSWDSLVVLGFRFTTLMPTNVSTGSTAMGKRRFATISAAATRPEPRDSWMRDLQLQTITVDTARWQGTQQQSLWQAFTPRPRVRKLH